MSDKMQIACHAWAYTNLSLREAVGTIARLGFRAVDIGSGPHFSLGTVAQDPIGFGRHVRQIVSDFDMEISDVYLVMTHVNSPDPTTRNTRLRLFDRLLAFAQVIRASGVTVSPGIVHDDGYRHSFARAIPCLQYMVDLAQARNVRLSFEPHLDSVAPDPEAATLLMSAVPDLKLTLDIAHWITQGIGWRQIKPMLANAAHVQIRQARKNKLQTVFEKGKVDIELLIESLFEVGYQGALSIEYMNAVGWHGMEAVDYTREIDLTRHAVRNARDKALSGTLEDN
jgi:sugar phosphate isomerase/epimerase